MNKIIVCGFPHCGTSILKSVIGHCEEVCEIIKEKKHIEQPSVSHKYTLCKDPFPLSSKFDYSDYTKIMIMRNPVYVFSSLNRRFDREIGRTCLPDNHSIESYIQALSIFDEINSGENNFHKLIYSQIFENDFLEIRKLLDSLDLNYDDKIFDNSLWFNRIICRDVWSKKDGIISPKKHAAYRTYQINQPFSNKNDSDKIHLSEQQIMEIKQSEIINKYFDTSMVG